MALSGQRRLLALVLATAALSSGCISGGRAERGRRGFEQSGIASWYGPGFHGRTTANGETYDMEAMTAAHKKLPFGSIVEVRNRDNGRRTRVRINDRGPFVRGRIIDLSKAAAREIGMIGAGTARVKIRVIGRSERRLRGSKRYTVQAGAFRERLRAQDRLAAVRRHYPAAQLDAGRGVHRVVITGLARSAADDAVRVLRRHGIEAIVRR
ncbi:MAG: septal ring lytic transglycosylase RlpA family protein [Thermoanaerobaculia bacterium]